MDELLQGHGIVSLAEDCVYVTGSKGPLDDGGRARSTSSRTASRERLSRVTPGPRATHVRSDPGERARPTGAAAAEVAGGSVLVGPFAQELLELGADLVGRRQLADVGGQQAGLLAALHVGVVLALQGLDDLLDLLGARDLPGDLGPVEPGRRGQVLGGMLGRSRR